MNTAPLKSVGFWIAAVVAVLGVLLSQHVVADGGTVATIIGWVGTILGSVGAGHQAAGALAASPTP